MRIATFTVISMDKEAKKSNFTKTVLVLNVKLHAFGISIDFNLVAIRSVLLRPGGVAA